LCLAQRNLIDYFKKQIVQNLQEIIKVKILFQTNDFSLTYPITSTTICFVSRVIVLFILLSLIHSLVTSLTHIALPPLSLLRSHCKLFSPNPNPHFEILHSPRYFPFHFFLGLRFSIFDSTAFHATCLVSFVFITM